jgi:hypothetical protein
MPPVVRELVVRHVASGATINVVGHILVSLGAAIPRVEVNRALAHGVTSRRAHQQTGPSSVS